MMHAICVETGSVWRIRRTVMGPADFAEAQCDEGEHIALVDRSVDPRTYYINPETGKPNKRQPSPCTPSRTEVPADGATHVTLSQMREGTQVNIRGPVNDDFTASGSDQITFAVPGRYTITATAAFPALPREIQINAS